jgi:two-component system, NtrC family, sensor histidine kinase HydH
MTLRNEKITAGMQRSPWIILGATAILLVVVMTMAIQNTRREKRHMGQVLLTKGAVLIRGVEAGSRAGMMGMTWGGAQVQRLLEETSRLPDVLYMAVIDDEGKILAHSDPGRIGQTFRSDPHRVQLEPEQQESWELVTRSDGRRVFEVHRYFRPVPPNWQNRMGAMMRRHHALQKDGSDWFDPQKRPEQIIIAGLDISPFESAIADDIRQTVLLSIVLLLLGFAGFVSLFWMQSYRAARRSLQDTSAFADEVVAHLPVGLVATDRKGRIAFFNAAAARLTGIAPAEALGRETGEVLPARLCGLQQVLDDGRSISEEEMECPFGARASVPVSVSATRILNPEKQLVGHVLILRDLGEVRRLQAQIRRQEKLAALGGLAAGVAHEIRNPLSSIKGLATYFADRFAADSKERDLAQVMTREVDRLNRVISELLEFARPTDLKRQATEINPLLEHSLQLIQQDAAAKQIEIVRRFADNVCPAHIDPDRLAQALLNLYLNAIQAMSPGGCLTVNSSPQPGGGVAIEIHDSGSGISEEHLDRIFDPYFTTKAKGTGLGLAIVHKIVEAHQGRIEVQSTPGQGTRFGLYFPCRPAEGDHG